MKLQNKIKLLVSAMLATCSLGAFAQSSVTIYGIVDSAVEYAKYNQGVPGTYQAASGNLQASRLGFRGSEDLGGGLRANFQLEEGFNIDNGTAGGTVMWNRGSTVGLSGNFGSFDLGNMYLPIYWVFLGSDASTYGLSNLSAIMSLQHTAALGFTGTGGFYSNSVRYRTPVFHGLSAELGYSFGKQNIVAQTEDGRNIGFNVQYANGPLKVGYGFNRYSFYATPIATSASSQITQIGGGTYDFGIAVVGANYLYTKRTDNNWFGSSWLLNAKVPVGAGDINVGTSHLIESGGKVAMAFHLGYVYHLSKRTDLYSYAAYIHNNAAGTRGFALLNSTYAQVQPGYSPAAFTLGLRHAF